MFFINYMDQVFFIIWRSEGMGKLFPSVSVEMIKFVLCGVVCCVFSSCFLQSPVVPFFTPVGSVIKSRLQTQTEFMHRSFTQIFNHILPPSAFPSVPHQDTKSPTDWTAGTLSVGPRWRWAPMGDSSLSLDLPLSRPMCSDSSLARLWAGVKNRKLWLLQLNVEVT